MKLLDLYKDILKMGWMTVNEDGLISMSSRLNADDNGGSDPVIIDGKRLVMPTQYHLDHPDPKQKVIFHPLSESILLGESAVVSKLRRVYSVMINLAILKLIEDLITLGLSVADHKKLSPGQAEILSILKDVDARTQKDMSKMIVNAVKKDGVDGMFFKLYLKKGGTVDGKKYSKAGIATFPFYNEISQDKAEHYGVTIRKKDHLMIQKLMEVILPGISEAHHYDRGSNSDIAPYLDALLRTVQAVGSDLNKLSKKFHKFLSHPEMTEVSLDWVEGMDNISEYLSEIRRIPAQLGNQGSRKTEEIMQEDLNLRDALNQGVNQAINRSNEINEKVTASHTNAMPVAPVERPLAPWEDAPAPAPTTSLVPQAAMAAPVMQAPMMSQQPAQNSMDLMSFLGGSRPANQYQQPMQFSQGFANMGVGGSYL